jgi:hypothetical protein
MKLENLVEILLDFMNLKGYTLFSSLKNTMVNVLNSLSGKLYLKFIRLI